MLDNFRPTVIALGYFDSVHLGHQMVIKRAKEIAQKNNMSLTVFTFYGNLKGAIGGQDKCVFLSHEREKFLKDLGVDEIYFAPVTKEFLQTDKKDFLDYLNIKYNIKYYVSGVDYTFGAFGKGNTEYLTDYAIKNGQQHVIVDTFLMSNQKVSTTLVKSLLSLGDVKGANALLGRNYSISGVVVKDRQVGTSLGFPTANILLDKDKFCICDGVYLGKVIIDNKDYYAIINYGARPTFDLEQKLLEVHIVDFCGYLYGKELEVFFVDYIRPIKKFESALELKKQLQSDLSLAREGKYD